MKAGKGGKGPARASAVATWKGSIPGAGRQEAVTDR